MPLIIGRPPMLTLAALTPRNLLRYRPCAGADFQNCAACLDNVGNGLANVGLAQVGLDTAKVELGEFFAGITQAFNGRVVDLNEA
ncbi:MAG: hypothetical protein IPL05_10330 [Betaproteobacteria bacterium]|nr:hypothetical protein [Betaproteobacteria bacterium]